MPRKYIHRIHILFVALFLAMIAVYFVLMHKRMMIAVTNNSNAIIQSVIVKFTGGTVKLGPLQKMERQEVEIKPATDSHLEIDVYSETKIIEQCVIDVYLDQSSTGIFEIILDKGLVVKAFTRDGTNSYSVGCEK
jgi:hypothetical protein